MKRRAIRVASRSRSRRWRAPRAPCEASTEASALASEMSPRRTSRRARRSRRRFVTWNGSPRGAASSGAVVFIELDRGAACSRVATPPGSAKSRGSQEKANNLPAKTCGPCPPSKRRTSHDGLSRSASPRCPSYTPTPSPPARPLAPTLVGGPLLVARDLPRQKATWLSGKARGTVVPRARGHPAAVGGRAGSTPDAFAVLEATPDDTYVDVVFKERRILSLPRAVAEGRVLRSEITSSPTPARGSCPCFRRTPGATPT